MEHSGENEKYNVRAEYQCLTAAEIQDVYKGKSNEVTLGIINIQLGTNVGLIVRTASLFGIGKIVLFGRKRFDKRSSVGAYHYVPISTHSASIGHHDGIQLDIPKVIEAIKLYQDTHTLVFLEQTPTSISLVRLNETLADLKSDKPPMFIAGTESTGIPQEILDLFPAVPRIVIPQTAVGRSHNVGVSISMVLWEYFRGRPELLN
jgi:tRNA(Leu) C34 or U34 (ribose-2'-O)-methylase TrmL